jgi:hypothetical protein
MKTGTASCPGCGTRLDHAIRVTSSRPVTSGTFSLCVICAELLIYDENLCIRRPTSGEMERLKKINGALEHIASYRKMIIASSQ